MVAYTITHTTGIKKRAAGDMGGNYFFTLIGTVGETAAHICPANREKGQTGSCNLQDRSRIGRLNALKIKNIVDDGWRFVFMEVQVAGLTGSWRYQGDIVLGHKKSLILNLVLMFMFFPSKCLSFKFSII